MAPACRLLPALLLLAACAGVEGELRRAEFREGVLDLVKGKDRGIYAYRLAIRDAIAQARGAHRYQYVVPAHLSHYIVGRSVRGLGGTNLADAADLALAADQLLDVAARDPTASTRASACHQLGRILLRLGLPLDVGVTGSPQSEARIHEAALDLLNQRQRIDKGEPVPVKDVVERMQALVAERPVGLRSAREAVRAMASPPVTPTNSPSIAKAAQDLVPALVRDAVLASLAEIACGRPDSPDEPDEAPLVRLHAAEVLTRLASPVALEGAVRRLADRLDPAERDEDVRRQLVQYLGAVGGAGAFGACLARLEDSDSGVRYHAHGALTRMTGTRVEPTAAAWRAYEAAQAAPGK